MSANNNTQESLHVRVGKVVDCRFLGEMNAPKLNVETSESPTQSWAQKHLASIISNQNQLKR